MKILSHPKTFGLRTASLALTLALFESVAPLRAASPNSEITPPPPPTDAPSFPCGGLNPKGVILWPMTQTSNPEFTDQGADCSMWQNFIYLNWPAATGKRGVPDYKAAFGTPGTTVWETYPTAEQVFLPGGATPPPWTQSIQSSKLPASLAADAASGRVRVLTRQTKVSPKIAALRKQLALANTPGVPLDITTQADGNVLYDQNKNPVYYEVVMNQTLYDYIVSNGLYNADTQATYASKTNIVLPSGSMELKAAWKILTPKEVSSGRFHTAKGYIPANGNNSPAVDIGLVGLHVFVSEGDQNAGLWATFYQVDNAPVSGAPTTGTYSFYNSQSKTPPNTAGTNPTQVVQMIRNDSTAITENTYAQKLFIQGNKNAPWQYYAMVATQWSKAVLNLSTPVPARFPLSPGPTDKISPSVTLMNPVLETFMQTPGVGCMGCHSSATTKNGAAASGFSFLFGNASSPSKP